MSPTRTTKRSSFKVERRLTHPVLKKTVRLTKKYHAHDEGNKFHEGDVVRIQECPPISKNKRWVVLEQEVSARLVRVN